MDNGKAVVAPAARQLFSQVLGDISSSGQLEGCMFPIDRFRSSMLRLHYELSTKGQMTQVESDIAGLCERFETLAGSISSEIKEMDRISTELKQLLKEVRQ